MRLFQVSATGVAVLGVSVPLTCVPMDMTRGFCSGGVKLAPALAGQVVCVCPACTGLAMVVGLPRPPPSCPSTTSEVDTGNWLVNCTTRLLPAGTVMVGPTDQVAPQGCGAAVLTGTPASLLSTRPSQEPHMGTVAPSGSVICVR